MFNLEIPEGPEAITSEWLTQMLRTTKVIQRTKVVSVDATPIGVGIGFVGRIIRLVLHYDITESDAPHSLVAKFPSTNPSLQRYWTSPQSLYDGINSYMTIDPQPS